MVPSATNLLGLVKHLIGIELSYLGDSVGRPSEIRLPWVEDGSNWMRRRACRGGPRSVAERLSATCWCA
jgi:hypothetical protein